MSEDRSFPPLVDQCWILTGPTAAGKSTVAAQLAELLGAEILSLDSMAVYRGMDIGTAKPTAEQRARTAHHLIDLVDPTEDFSVAAYLQQAHRAVAELLSAGKTPLFVGGTPMYLKAVIRGFDPGPPADWEFRRQVDEDVRRYGAEALHQRLMQVDPLAAHRLHPHDVRRMTRALEVAYVTGQPLSHRQIQFERGRAAADCRVFALRWSRAELHRRIEARVTGMFQAGLVEETAGLLQRYRDLSRTAAMAVGYREVIAHLRSQTPADQTVQTVQAVQAHTRQLARRQETWMRSFSEIRAVPMDAHIAPAAVAEQLLLGGGGP